MCSEYTKTKKSKGGISQRNRELLELLHREAEAPFTVEEATRTLKLERRRTRRLLAHLAERGWLVRIRRGLYAPVPLEASIPSEWRVDPWTVAAGVFSPCYIGGWSACEHWGLTDQIFRVVVVLTTQTVRDRHPVIQNIRFWLKTVSQERLFGLRSVWRGTDRLYVSDPSRTIVDMLDSPSLVGGIRHGAEILSVYFEEFLEEDLLLEYLDHFGNRTAYKRLGHLMEHLHLESERLRRACRQGISSGYSLLDPSAPGRGPHLKRWNLRLNVTLEGVGR